LNAIFKRDFKAYFTSPIGYVYIGAYILVLNFVFYLMNVLASTSSVAQIFSWMLTIMMFVTPILTMRVFSEDYKQKTDQLLCTAPVSTASIVMGKFYASITVFLVLLGLTLAWPIIISIFGQVNLDEVVGNYIGIFFIGIAYISMGIFISALTENQVVAAVSSLGLFIALMFIDWFAMAFFATGVLPTFVMQAFLFVSIFGRYTDITRGLLSLDTVVFFVSVTAVFLFLTMRALERRRQG